jgi:hypothetical protein
MKQPCLDCGTPTSGTRCPTHLRAHLHKRDTRQTAARKQQGGRPKYGGTYRGEAAAVRATATVCWLCTYGPRADDPWQADHIRQFEREGGDGGLAAAHRSCNIRRRHLAARGFTHEQIVARLKASQGPRQARRGPG